MKCDRREFIVAVGAGAVAACGNQGGQNQSGNPVLTAKADMDPGYRVRLTGLIGTSVSGTPSQLDVFVVDGQKTLQRPHLPFLIIPAAIVTGGAATKDDQQVLNGVDSLIWKLDGYQVNVEGVGTAANLPNLLTTGVVPVLNHRHPGSKAPDPRPNPITPSADEDDATWIAQLEKIPGLPSVTGSPHLGAIHASCRAADPRPAKVAARAHFSVGNLAARFPAKWRDKTFQFGTGSNAYNQALALGEVRIPKAYTSLTISLLPFDAASTLVPKTLTVTRGTSDAILELANEPAPGPFKCTTDDDVQKLHHFQAYYQLLDPASTTITGPIPECVGPNCPTCASIGTTAAHESEFVYCPMGSYP